MGRLLFGLFLCISVISTAQAEIKKRAKLCDGGDISKICPFFLPSFKVPEGWVRDESRGNQLGVDLFVPAGKNFGNAPALIYADARPLSKDTTLEQWVNGSDEKWKTAGTGAAVSSLASSEFDIGKSDLLFRRYENKALKNQPSELIAYFVEQDENKQSYVVRLVVSGLSEKAVAEARNTFALMLKSY
jgi:hypothetical protein